MSDEFESAIQSLKVVHNNQISTLKTESIKLKSQLLNSHEKFEKLQLLYDRMEVRNNELSKNIKSLAAFKETVISSLKNESLDFDFGKPSFDLNDTAPGTEPSINITITLTKMQNSHDVTASLDLNMHQDADNKNTITVEMVVHKKRDQHHRSTVNWIQS